MQGKKSHPPEEGLLKILILMQKVSTYLGFAVPLSTLFVILIFWGIGGSQVLNVVFMLFTIWGGTFSASLFILSLPLVFIKRKFDGALLVNFFALLLATICFFVTISRIIK